MSLIFATGLPRTGTTWVASLISAAAGSELAFEPYNWRLNPDATEFHMKYLPCGSDDPDFIRIAEKAFATSERVVLKDVHCCLAVEYLWEILKPIVVIIIRHPCAMANSWNKVGWDAGFRIEILLNQARLLAEHLEPFMAHMTSSDDYFFQLGSYWGASYYVLDRIAHGHEDWHWANHEALCREPAVGFAVMLEKMGISMGDEGHAFLREHDRELGAHEDPLDIPARVTALQPHMWKHELEPQQIDSVLEGARPFGLLERYYRPSEEQDDRFQFIER